MKPTLPPGKNDLDILQNLKKIIKDGQHPFFRAVPQPVALASIYMGPTVSPVDSRPQPDSRGVPGSSQGQSVDSRSERVGSVVDPTSTSDRIVPPQSQVQPTVAAAATAAASTSDRIVPPQSQVQPPAAVTSAADVSTSDRIVPPQLQAQPPATAADADTSTSDRIVPPQSQVQSPAAAADPGHTRRPKFYKDRGGGGGGRGHMPGGGQAAPRSFHPHSPPPDSRAAKPLSSPPGAPHRHPPRGPPGRAPPGGEIYGRREWQYQQYPPSSGIPQNWDIDEGWDRPGDRDRFERDVPSRSAGWEYRGEREFIARGGFSVFHCGR
jgi:hypothetical protein